MRLATETPLTHRERLTRGLAHTAGGPVDVARGAVGLGGAAVHRGAVELRRRYRESQLSDRVADVADAAARELAAAQEVVAGLPQLLEGAPPRRRIRRSWLVLGAAGAALVAGGVVAVLIRRSNRPQEPSPRPPSVDAQPTL
ncbi:cell wall synthesis protein CwsA [Mycolicibacter engbaekii]|uniref:Cell wall synthesis protein CwsA n=1 Tax=Mycolicibacter engbaekii TaxID=188915 RepID=A0A1X1TN84_9MYCO|nr:cell wall synthesis protein CwsA [Mycolicibacter engbaekii]ORV46041.1 cell wall synthesis protein CwsA [Mycolicibacter engbaekii]